MSRTFYGVLGVGPDADEEAIRAAYRERVKDHHPDVSSDPDAAVRFKRLTAAKETLLDPTERARYDRFGHRAYVAAHADSALWTTEASAAAASTADSSTTGTRDARETVGRDRGGTRDATDESPANGSDRKTATENRRRRPASADPSNTGRRRRTRRPSGSYAATSFWGTAERSPGAGRSSGQATRRALAALRRLGPWIPVHALFLSLAVGTGWYVYAVVLPPAERSAALLFVLIGEVGLAVVLSSLHILTRLYR
ncbi:DnaJ domain-containing protein [Halosimplex marinum]|uniref:DnaJ domain-containing protein n=1 Tax=Halosimplex marinum TaxID=3396620 RepID=UPI003F54594A